jgi:hypothetical protein
MIINDNERHQKTPLLTTNIATNMDTKKVRILRSDSRAKIRDTGKNILRPHLTCPDENNILDIYA